MKLLKTDPIYEGLPAFLKGARSVRIYEFAGERYEAVMREATHSRESGTPLTITPELERWARVQAERERDRVQQIAARVEVAEKAAAAAAEGGAP